MENVCRFVGVTHSPEPIQTINFVYETKNLTLGGAVTESVCKACIVTSGNATILLGTSSKKLKKNDIFFIFPATPYTLSTSENFTFIYISFIGIRSGMIMERLGIDKKNFIFPNYPEVRKLWETSLAFKSEILDITSEALLLYAFSAIGNRVLVRKSNESEENAEKNILLVKKYVDENFSDPSLSLEKTSKVFSYNKNYLSTAFKKSFKVGLKEYINIIRINNACLLIERNHSKTVGEIASLCGYNDRMYFSKVFKERTGFSPKHYMMKNEKNKNFSKKN